MFHNYKLVLVLLSLFLSGSAKAQTTFDGSVEEISVKLRKFETSLGESETLVIGIPAFRHADESCSDLGNLLADQLLEKMHPDRPKGVQYVTRTQIGAIERELSTNSGNRFDANQIAALGKRVGATALVLGTIHEATTYADITVQLVNVESGFALAVSSSRFQLTDIEKGRTRNKSLSVCPENRHRGVGTTSPTIDGARVTRVADQNDDIQVRVMSATYNRAEERIELSVDIRNRTKRNLKVGLLDKLPIISDKVGKGLVIYNSTWLSACGGNRPDYCSDKEWKSILPEEVQTTTFYFQSPEYFSVASSLVMNIAIRSYRELHGRYVEYSEYFQFGELEIILGE